MNSKRDFLRGWAVLVLVGMSIHLSASAESEILSFSRLFCFSNARPLALPQGDIAPLFSGNVPTPQYIWGVVNTPKENRVSKPLFLIDWSRGELTSLSPNDPQKYIQVEVNLKKTAVVFEGVNSRITINLNTRLLVQQDFEVQHGAKVLDRPRIPYANLQFEDASGDDVQ